MDNVRFDDTATNKTILKQLASNFVGLKQLTIKFYSQIPVGVVDKKLLAFWQILNPIVLKNNGKVELNVSIFYESVIVLNEILDNKHVLLSK